MSYSASRKWYQAPWFWITGSCCLGCIVVPLACVAVIGTGGFLALTNSPMLSDAMDIARQSPALVAELGEPIESRFLAGSTNLSMEGRSASLTITIGGPNGTARLSGEAIRRGGDWSYEWLEARLEDGRVIDVLTNEVSEDAREFEQISFDEALDASEGAATLPEEENTPDSPP